MSQMKFPLIPFSIVLKSSQKCFVQKYTQQYAEIGYTTEGTNGWISIMN